MKYTIKELMSDSEILSHLFLGCVPHTKLMEIKEKAGDWKENNYSLNVEMKIDGLSIDSRKFFKIFIEQYDAMVIKEAKKLVEEVSCSSKMRDIQQKLYEYEEIVKSWEEDINWDVKNPFLEKKV